MSNFTKRLDHLERRLRKSIEKTRTNITPDVAQGRYNRRSALTGLRPKYAMKSRESRPRTITKKNKPAPTLMSNFDTFRSKDPIIKTMEDDLKVIRGNLDREAYRQRYEKRNRYNKMPNTPGVGGLRRPRLSTSKNVNKPAFEGNLDVPRFVKTDRISYNGRSRSRRTNSRSSYRSQPGSPVKQNYISSEPFEQEEYADYSSYPAVTPQRSYRNSEIPQNAHHPHLRLQRDTNKFEKFKQKYQKKAAELANTFSQNNQKLKFTARGAVNYPISGTGNSKSSFHPGLTRRYSYGNISQSYLSRIQDQDFFANPGSSFHRYLKECKEDLELAYRAQQFFNSRPLALPPVHLYQDFESMNKKIFTKDNKFDKKPEICCNDQSPGSIISSSDDLGFDLFSGIEEKLDDTEKPISPFGPDCTNPGDLRPSSSILASTSNLIKNIFSSCSTFQPSIPSSPRFSLGQKTLILDLDETLIHAEDYNPQKSYDLVVEMPPTVPGTAEVSLAPT